MGYAVIKQDNDVTYNLKELICDTAAEITNIPTTYAPGSTVFCIDTADMYMLNTSKVWTLIGDHS